MTEIEAIEELKYDCNELGKAIPYDTSWGCSFENAYGMAIQALEKQIPKKPRKTDSYKGVLKRVYAYVCPTCGNVCLEKYMNERQNTMFCWNCGQKLDWSDEE
jgi:hypothetical protein